MKSKKILVKFIIIILLFFIYSYVVALQNLPENLVVFEGEQVSLKTIFGMKMELIENNEVVETVANNQIAISGSLGEKKIKLSIFDKFCVKDIDLEVLPKMKVVPLGNLVGIKLHTNGVLVVGMSEIQGIDEKKYKPYANTGIVEGDTILEINNKVVENTEQLIDRVNECKGELVKIKYLHEENTIECSMKPVETKANQYKLGLWVRDSAAGVGTLTFYEPISKKVEGLGHGITDVDTGELINISSGELVTTKILNIVRGKKSEPGKIQGTVDNQKSLGVIVTNTKFGIYGTLNNKNNLKMDESKALEVALRDEITEGEATILCELENDAIEEYKIEIKKIYKDNNYDNKSMIIKIVDSELLEKTGGIIQGMSGSPIIQNGKFVGAVTHVLVNDPSLGYAVFGDIMVKQLNEKIN